MRATILLMSGNAHVAEELYVLLSRLVHLSETDCMREVSLDGTVTLEPRRFGTPHVRFSIAHRNGEKLSIDGVPPSNLYLGVVCDDLVELSAIITFIGSYVQVFFTGQAAHQGVPVESLWSWKTDRSKGLSSALTVSPGLLAA